MPQPAVNCRPLRDSVGVLDLDKTEYRARRAQSYRLAVCWQPHRGAGSYPEHPGRRARGGRQHSHRRWCLQARQHALRRSLPVIGYWPGRWKDRGDWAATQARDEPARAAMVTLDLLRRRTLSGCRRAHRLVRLIPGSVQGVRAGCAPTRSRPRHKSVQPSRPLTHARATMPATDAAKGLSPCPGRSCSWFCRS